MSVRSIRSWLIALATVLGLAATLALGIWHLDRAHQKLALQAAIEAKKRLPALDQRALVAANGAPDLMYREVMLRGTWVAPHTVFLDNRQMLGRPGFYVLTPLRLAGSDAVVLVQRGWVQRNFLERERLPSIETPVGVVQLRGRIAPPPAKLYEFEGAGSGPIRQNLDMTDFGAETRLALLALLVVQIDPASEGLKRDWPEAASGVEKHYGYAFQWLALSGLITILYVWFQFIAPRRKATHA